MPSGLSHPPLKYRRNIYRLQSANFISRQRAIIKDTLQIQSLNDDPSLHQTVADLILTAFDNPERYGRGRLLDQLAPAPLPYYRQFFVARRGDEVVGAGGIKAADWASDTHILYLSAVAEHARGQGVARALIHTRIAWVMERFGHGRLLVSTARPRRFTRLGFRIAGKYDASGRRLMLLEF